MRYCILTFLGLVMPNNFIKLANAAINGDGELPTWRQLLAEFSELQKRPLSADEIAQLRAILYFDGRLQLAPKTDLPHRMSPLDMLKLRIKNLLELNCPS